ncbi:TadE family protein [Marmoricola sp. RAF53]|uniref:TadE family protein n=1 Tax=Marmoricola sp. RAF53 TaxID=3233059 RepID=UPI003F9B887F
MIVRGSGQRDERGAAVVETALCLCFIVLPLVFATIGYAYMLSFRQTVSQSATEGARAAAVAPAGIDDSVREAAAINAINEALATGTGGLKCNTGYMICTVKPKEVGCGDGSTGSCMTVVVEYPYRDHSLLPTIPGLGFTLPKTVSYSATARVS